MLNEATTAVCCKNYTEHINTLCGQNVEFLVFHLMARTVSNGVVIPKVWPVYPKGWATSSKGIRGYISVMDTSKFIIF